MVPVSSLIHVFIKAGLRKAVMFLQGLVGVDHGSSCLLGCTYVYAEAVS